MKFTTLDFEDQISSTIENLMTKHSVEGFSIAVIEESKIIWKQGFGLRNKEKNEETNTDTVFEFASLTKPLVSYVALKLVEEGLLNLSTPLNDYLPEPYLEDEPLVKKTTLKHILTHTSGFPNWRPKGEKLRIHFIPGERFSYSGEGFMYLQKVVESITEQSLESLLHEKIFEPFNIENASLIWQDGFSDYIAQGYTEESKPREKWKPTNPVAASSLHISSADYAKFIIELMRSENLTSNHLKLESLDSMLTPTIPVNDAGLNGRHSVPNAEILEHKNVFWGLGIGIEKIAGKTNFWHWGDNHTFQSYVYGNRETQNGFVIASNSYNARGMWSELIPSLVQEELPSLTWLNSFS